MVEEQNQEFTNQDIQLALWRLSVIQLVEQIGNISEACKRMGMDRKSFYEFRRRHAQYGLDGLINRTSAHVSHPHATSLELIEHIVATSLSHPSWGSSHIRDQLLEQDYHVSATTIQSILDRHGLGNKPRRLAYLEILALRDLINLSNEQILLIEQYNPAFRERGNESECPGRLLVQDTYPIRLSKVNNSLYLHMVIDTYNSLVFGVLSFNKQPEPATSLLNETVLPFYNSHNLKVVSILTDADHEFYRANNNLYTLFLRSKNINHKLSNGRSQTNGFIRRFQRIILNEFIQPTIQRKYHKYSEVPQSEFDDWINYYNKEYPIQGYRNMGESPIERLNKYLQ